jgi:hypothetical protein
MDGSHPGDCTNIDTYSMHCPEAAPPTIMFLGIVVRSGGCLNSGTTLLHYDLHTTVYDSSAKARTSFTVRIYFKNGRRWANFPLLMQQTPIIMAGHICGLTSGECHLAVLVDDIHFVPGSPLSRVTPAQTPQSSTGAKRTPQDRWSRRAAVGMGTEPVTPSKKRRRVPDNDQAKVDMQLLDAASSAFLTTLSATDEPGKLDEEDSNLEVDEPSTTTAISWPSTPPPVMSGSPQDRRPRRIRRPPNH